MLVTFSAPSIETSAAGDEVSQRVLTCGSQTEQIQVLRGMVTEYRSFHTIRSRARDIVFRQWPTPPKDRRGQALAIAGWVQRNIRYVEEDPEIFQTPPTTVAQGYGDCDDFSSLIASLLESIAIETELVGMCWPDRERRRVFQHIYPRAILPNGERIPLDATLPWPIDYKIDPIRLAHERGLKLQLFIG